MWAADYRNGAELAMKENQRVEHGPRIAIRQVDESTFRLFIDRCGEAVRVTENQLRRVVAIAVDTLCTGDPAIEAVVAAAREERGFFGELDIDPGTALAVARQMELYRAMARLSAALPVPAPLERQMAA